MVLQSKWDPNQNEFLCKLEISIRARSVLKVQNLVKTGTLVSLIDGPLINFKFFCNSLHSAIVLISTL